MHHQDLMRVRRPYSTVQYFLVFEIEPDDWHACRSMPDVDQLMSDSTQGCGSRPCQNGDRLIRMLDRVGDGAIAVWRQQNYRLCTAVEVHQ